MHKYKSPFFVPLLNMAHQPHTLMKLKKDKNKGQKQEVPKKRIVRKIGERERWIYGLLLVFVSLSLLVSVVRYFFR